MDSLPILKPQELVRALLRGGFYIHHQTGSHARLLHRTRPELKVRVVFVEHMDFIEVITTYLTTKIGKYWRCDHENKI